MRKPFDLEAFHERVYRSRPPRLHPSRIGLVVIAIIVMLSYLAVFKSVPFTSPGYELDAVFESSNTIVSGSPVRIAGVDVGEVTGVEPRGDGAVVRFTVTDAGRPIRADAKATIRPRLFLEGNLFVDLEPGSPGTDELPDGGTIPVTRTAQAVQFDQVVGTLTRPAREDLRRLIHGFGTALVRTPTAAEDENQDRDVLGESAATALNDALRYGGDAGRSAAILARAMRGVEGNELGSFVDDGSHVLAVLAAREAELGELVGNLSATAGALAAESGSLRRTIAELDPTLRVAQPALRSTERTLPALRSFAREMTVSIGELPAAIDAGTPWLGQARPLLGQGELGGIASMLSAGTPGLAGATDALAGAFSGVEALSRCATEVLVPVADTEIADPSSIGAPVYADFFYGTVAQAGEGASFDGNGSYLRVQPGGGPVRVSADNPNGGFRNEALYGNAIRPPLGTQPAMAARRPPIRYDIDCHANAVPDLNGAAATPGPPTPRAAP